MKWSFAVTKERPFKETKTEREFFFGQWEYPGYMSSKILFVHGSSVMKKSGYENKVEWRGNISTECRDSCIGEITLFNLTRTDFKRYGITIFIHPYIHPLQNSLRIVRRGGE